MDGRLPGRRRFSGLAERIAPFAVLFCLSLVVHWTYLVQPGRPFYIDSTLPLSYPDFARFYFQVWNDNQGSLNFARFMRVPYVWPLYTVFRTVGVDVTLFVKFLFWLPTYLGMASGYVFFRRTLGDRAGSTRLVAVSLLLAVFYGLNPWITKHYAQYYFGVSVAFLPLALLFFVEYVDGGRPRHLVLAAAFAVLVAMNPHFMVYFFVLAGMYTVFDALLSGSPVRSMTRGALVVVLFVLASLFWILPFLYLTLNGEGVVGYQVGTRIVTLSSQRNTPVNLLSYMGGYWRGITRADWWLFEPLWLYQTVFLLVPVTAFAGFLASEDDDRFALFSAAAVLTLLVPATGYNYVGVLYDAILALPFHGVLRAPERILAVTPLLYGYLAGRAILNGRRWRVRAGATGALVVVCLTLVLLNVHVFSTALAPTVLPTDHAHVEDADYEDAFVSPPRSLGGYDPTWMDSREDGIVNSWDTHFYAVPDSRQHVFSFYLLELIDQNRTGTAVDVLRKTGANHFLVRRDTGDRRGIPPATEQIAELDDEPGVTREYTGRNLVVYDLNAADEPFRVVEPVRVRRDVHAAARFADDPGVYPYFRFPGSTDPLAERVEKDQFFHPSTMFRRLNRRDVLSRPPTYRGFLVRDRSRFTLPETEGTLVFRGTPLSGGVSVVRETPAGQEVYLVRDGNRQTNVSLDGPGRELTIRGTVYVERLYVVGDSAEERARPVNTSFHGAGTITPSRTNLSVERDDSAVTVEYDRSPDAGFFQASFDTTPPIDGPFTVTASVTAPPGDRFGLVLLPENGSAQLLGTSESLDGGRQTVTIRVPAGYTDVGRIQFAVFPRKGPPRGRITVHEFSVNDLPNATRRPTRRSECEADPGGARCSGAADVRSIERLSPTRYAVTVDAEAPYALQFGESYDSLWAAEVNGTRYRSNSLYTATNGFWINETGTHTVIVRYLPQRWFEYGTRLSALVFALFGAVALYDYRRSRGGAPDLPEWVRDRLPADAVPSLDPRDGEDSSRGSAGRSTLASPDRTGGPDRESAGERDPDGTPAGGASGPDPPTEGGDDDRSDRRGGRP